MATANYGGRSDDPNYYQPPGAKFQIRKRSGRSTNTRQYQAPNGVEQNGQGYNRTGFQRRKWDVKGPSFGPINMSGLNMIKDRLATAGKYEANPLTAPGAQQAIQAINVGAQRRADMQQGQALGRAAQTGAAGFAGALQQTAGQIASDQNTAITEQTGQLASQLAQQYAEQGLSLTQAYAAAQNDINQLQQQQSEANQRYELARAQFEQEQDRLAAQDQLEQARLAENARQFDISRDDSNYRYDEDAAFRQQQADAEAEYRRQGFGFEQDKFNYQKSQDEANARTAESDRAYQRQQDDLNRQLQEQIRQRQESMQDYEFGKEKAIDREGGLTEDENGGFVYNRRGFGGSGLNWNQGERERRAGAGTSKNSKRLR